MVALPDIIDPRIKKESPNEGTETPSRLGYNAMYDKPIKKESPNEGTETEIRAATKALMKKIKKESPNEGTETTCQ